MLKRINPSVIAVRRFIVAFGIKMMLSNRLWNRALLRNSSLPMRRLKLHEYQAGALLNSYNVPIPVGNVAFSADEAQKIASGI